VAAAWDRLRGLGADVVGNLDADVSFDPDYMGFLLARFAEAPRLGVAGTPFTQDGGYDSTRDSFEGENYVAGPASCSAPRVSRTSAGTCRIRPAAWTGSP
jgi:hypothetical protein